MHGILFMQLHSDAAIIAAGRTRYCVARCLHYESWNRSCVNNYVLHNAVLAAGGSPAELRACYAKAVR